MNEDRNDTPLVNHILVKCIYWKSQYSLLSFSRISGASCGHDKDTLLILRKQLEKIYGAAFAARRLKSLESSPTPSLGNTEKAFVVVSLSSHI